MRTAVKSLHCSRRDSDLSILCLTRSDQLHSAASRSGPRVVKIDPIHFRAESLARLPYVALFSFCVVIFCCIFRFADVCMLLLY